MRLVVLVLSGRPIEVQVGALQLVNIAFTLMAVLTFYFVVRRIGARPWASAVYSLFFGLSRGVLAYSSQIEVYNVTILFLALAFLGLVLHRQASWSPLLVGVGYAAAMLFHQTAIFFGVAIVVTEAVDADSGSARRLVGMFVLPLAAVALLYLVAGWFAGCRGVPDYWQWLTSYAQAGAWGKGSLSIETILSALFGIGASVIRASFVPWQVSFTFLFVLLGVQVVWPLVVARRNIARNWRIAASCLAWLAVQTVFNAWWDAPNPEFWIIALLPGTLILAVFAHSQESLPCRTLPRKTAHVPIVAVTILLVISAIAHYQENNRENLLKLRVDQLATVVEEKDTIVADGTHLLQYCRLYIGNPHVIAINAHLATEAAKSSTPATFTEALLDALAEKVHSAEQCGRTTFVDRRIVEGTLPATHEMRHFDSERFSSGFVRRFTTTPAGGNGAPLWYAVTIATRQGALPDLDAEQYTG
jgi:hypothetical protein